VSGQDKYMKLLKAFKEFMTLMLLIEDYLDGTYTKEDFSQSFDEQVELLKDKLLECRDD